MCATSDLDPVTCLAIRVIQRCLAGDCVELIEKTLARYEATSYCCHDNVTEFVALYPKYQRVRGFLVSHQPTSDTSLVIAHSVVADIDGSLCDITPNDAMFRYPFVRHNGTRDEFEIIAAKEPFMVEVPNPLLRQLGVI